jgi:hypothetical protein
VEECGEERQFTARVCSAVQRSTVERSGKKKQTHRGFVHLQDMGLQMCLRLTYLDSSWQHAGLVLPVMACSYSGPFERPSLTPRSGASRCGSDTLGRNATGVGSGERLLLLTDFRYCCRFGS